MASSSHEFSLFRLAPRYRYDVPQKCRIPNKFVSEDTLGAVNSLRSVMLMWIVAVHRCSAKECPFMMQSQPDRVENNSTNVNSSAGIPIDVDGPKGVEVREPAAFG